jgi:hypothetical protein
MLSKIRYKHAMIDENQNPVSQISSKIRRNQNFRQAIIPVAVFGALWLVLVADLSQRWATNPEYSFGWFVPVLCAYLFFVRWRIRPPAELARDCRQMDIPDSGNRAISIDGASKSFSLLFPILICSVPYPRAGSKIAPRLLSEIGDDRERFGADAQALQCLGGTAPVTKRSGKYRHVHQRLASDTPSACSPSFC